VKKINIHPRWNNEESRLKIGGGANTDEHGNMTYRGATLSDKY
jgi:hypothetical protein